MVGFDLVEKFCDLVLILDVDNLDYYFNVRIETADQFLRLFQIRHTSACEVQGLWACFCK
jgi:hypothetical protein